MSGLVLATPDTAFEARVRGAFDGRLDGDLRVWNDGLAQGDCVHSVAILSGTGADVVALGPGIPTDEALHLARALDHEHPEISVVIVAPPSAALLRAALHAGARDVIAPDAPDQELRTALRFAIGAASHRKDVLVHHVEPEPAPRRMITVLCPKGGSGKTTIAVNLATGLAHRFPGRVVIADLDLQFGDVASALHLSPEHTIADAAREHQLDATGLKVFLTPHDDELFAMCAPETPVEADSISADTVGHILDLLHESFEYLVVDTASGLDEAALTALERSSDLVLVSAPDVPSIRSTRKELDAIRTITDPQQQLHFVLNRADTRSGVERRDIESTVGLTIDITIPESRAVSLSLNQGLPVVDLDPRAPVSRALLEIVERISPLPVAATPPASTPPPAGRGPFRRRR
jgi:pilus assembly protein CpaE